MASWARREDPGFDVLDRVQASLTVGMIMTPRDDLMTCRCKDMANDVRNKNKEDRFSFLPVVDDDADRIQGLFKAEEYFDKEAPCRPIGDDFEPFSEDLVIGADASIVDFVVKADERPTRLVVSGDRVAGLVSLSDLQQLPVRAALFTLITSLERTMARRIKMEWPGRPMDWLDLLSSRRRKRIQKAVCNAKDGNGFVSVIVLTLLSEKAAIVCEGRLLPEISKSRLKRDFRAIGKLRDSVAHANYYAETPDAARKVCETVRTILRIKEGLLSGIEA